MPHLQPRTVVLLLALVLVGLFHTTHATDADNRRHLRATSGIRRASAKLTALAHCKDTNVIAK